MSARWENRYLCQILCHWWRVLCIPRTSRCRRQDRISLVVLQICWIMPLPVCVYAHACAGSQNQIPLDVDVTEQVDRRNVSSQALTSTPDGLSWRCIDFRQHRGKVISRPKWLREIFLVWWHNFFSRHLASSPQYPAGQNSPFSCSCCRAQLSCLSHTSA